MNAMEIHTPAQRLFCLEELEPFQCKFPIGDPGLPGFGFCGAIRIPGKPYCGHHCRIAYRGVRADDDER